MAITKVTYIESHGHEYIDLGINFNSSTDKIEIVFQPTANPNDELIGGGNYQSAEGEFYFGDGGHNGEMIALFGQNGAFSTGTLPVDTSKFQTFLYENNSVYVDGVSVATNTLSINTLYNLILFGLNRISPMGLGSYKVKYVKVWRNGNLLKNFVAAKDDNSVFGLLENISGTFLYAAAGNLTGGEPIPASAGGYIGVGNVSKKLSAGYVGVGGISRRIVAGYVGVNGASKNIFSSGIGVYKKYTVSHEWEVHTIGAFHGSNFATDFIYTNGYPPFTTISETKPQFNFTNGIISQSLENGWNERCWAAFKIDGTTNPYSLKASELSGYHDYFIIITSASKNFLQVWSWDGYVNELVKKGDAKGTYIETLSAPEGIYPSNGIKDGYWYEKVAHFDENAALNKGNLIPLTGWLTSNYLEIPAGCTNITIETGLASGDHDCLCEYDSNRGYLSYWGAGANPRTFNFDYPNAIKYIRVTFRSSALDNCYVYDNTHGQYILKGANV